MLITIFRTAAYQTLILSLVNFRKTFKRFLDGFLAITLIITRGKCHLIVTSKKALEVQDLIWSIKSEESVKRFGGPY